jgi:phage FluMu protein gp41
MQTEFEFTLPKGYLDPEGNVHRRGVMRLSRAIDEIVPLRDPRVQANPAYATVIILARVITRLGDLEEVSPAAIENLFAVDLAYLQDFYREINGLVKSESE